VLQQRSIRVRNQLAALSTSAAVNRFDLLPFVAVFV
jgi:hypothetical protein